MLKFQGSTLDVNPIRLPPRYFTEEVLKVAFTILRLSILLMNWWLVLSGLDTTFCKHIFKISRQNDCDFKICNFFLVNLSKRWKFKLKPLFFKPLSKDAQFYYLNYVTNGQRQSDTLCEDFDNGSRCSRNVSISEYNFPGERKRRLFI